MAQPQKPPNLDPNHVYIHITSPSSPSTIADSLAPATGDNSLKYIGQGAPVKRDTEGGAGAGSGVVTALKGVEGVKGAKVLEVKQRAKRGGEF
ncbi:uncharacterized protein MKK02DRAFT_38804 [Dioszegia hungarica]|uniref:Uncharacterized protein n=1 Tax=Dioszegia hungarica TaxID=4972 RepID=A0AA38H5N2_9TREE|nr:uncharacterized protein MKK02DRAFT_38804 [Dioszegia hungarica]KAI9634132.1 hypothetical protein MKK02DRAFT_38804 [Dioszegia hungarica]